LFFFFFFFQAEDGIRDFHVTGVQTCALPIYPEFLFKQYSGIYKSLKFFFEIQESTVVGYGLRYLWEEFKAIRGFVFPSFHLLLRSEERRVGKECRSWWWA